MYVHVLMFYIILLLRCTLRSEITVCSIWKSLQVLQKVHMKIVARAIYTYRFFSYTYTLLLCWKIRSCIRPQTTVQWYTLHGYSSVKFGFNMINKCHTVFTMLVKINQVSIIVVLLRVCTTENFFLPRFLCTSKVLSMLHHRSRPRINVKKLYCKEKWAKQVKKLAAGKIFFTITFFF